MRARRRGGAADLGAEMADLLDQIMTEGLGGGCLARAFRLWNVVGGTKRECLEADLRVAAGARRRPEGYESPPFSPHPRARPEACPVGPVSIATGEIRRGTRARGSRP